MMNKKADIVAILEAISNTHYSDVNNPTVLLEYGFELTGFIAFSGECVAEAKEMLHKARKQAYINLVASLGAHEKKIGVMLMKDYCNDLCAEENAYLALCERANAAATHASDLVRSALSYLKTEMATINYNN
jgi:hypothetical protein